MKKIYIICLIIILCLVLVSCDFSNIDEEVPPAYELPYEFSSPNELLTCLNGDSNDPNIREYDECLSLYYEMLGRFEDGEITLKYPVIDGYTEELPNNDVLLCPFDTFNMPWIWYRYWGDNKTIIVQITYLNDELLEYSKTYSAWDVGRYVNPAMASREELKKNMHVEETTITTEYGEISVMYRETNDHDRSYLLFVLDDMMVQIFGSSEDVNLELMNKLHFVEVNDTGVENDSRQDVETDTGIDVDEPSSEAVDNSKCTYDSFIYELSENGGGIQVDEKAASFKIVEYIDESIPKTITMKLFGKEHRLIYDGSMYNPFCDQSINFYAIPGLDNGFSGLGYYPTVSMDAITGEIVGYSLFPYETMPKTENECIEFVKKIVGNAVEPEDLKCDIKTSYYISSENATRKTTIDGFYVCESNERLGAYTFRFSEYIDGIPTFKEVYAVFEDDIFTVRVSDPEHRNTVQQIPDFDEVEKSIKSEITSAINDKYTIESYSVISEKLFINKGVTYVLSNVEVFFKENGDTESLCMLVQIITEIK